MMLPGEQKEYRQVLKASPDYIMVEPTNMCRLRCITCSRDGIGTGTSMSYATFRRIMDQFPHATTVKFHGLGQPLLAPDATLMLEYLRDRNCQTVLVSECQWETLDVPAVMGCIEHMYISVSGSDKASYEAFHRGARWERLLANVSEIVHHRKAHTDLAINYVCCRQNLSSIPAVVKLADQLGVETVRFQIMQNWSGADNPRHEKLEELRRVNLTPLVGMLRTAMDIGEALSVNVRLVGNSEFDHKQCIWPFSRCYVTVDGDVLPCCMRPDNALKLGNMLQTQFEDIWNNEGYQSIRKQLGAGLSPEMCKCCPYIGCSEILRRVKRSLGLGPS